MLQVRTAAVLTSITRQYISKAAPVSSASVVGDYGLDVSSATIRNEMVSLEDGGYIIRPHHAAGSMPSDKGYRYYVDTLGQIEMPLAEKRMIEHLFHQVEENLEQWLGLAVTLLAQRVHNVAVVTTPKAPTCKIKHLEIVSMQDYTALMVLVLHGAILRQQLISFDQPMLQAELSVIAGKLADAYNGLTTSQIKVRKAKLSPIESRITEYILKMMQAEDGKGYEEPYLDGMHYLMNQPEFSSGQKMMSLMGLVEQRKLVEVMLPEDLEGGGVRVVIGSENREESVHDYSVVISRYGLSNEAFGTIAIVGPTRMPYARAISVVDYMAAMMSRLVAELYGRELPKSGSKAEDNQEPEE